MKFKKILLFTFTFFLLIVFFLSLYQVIKYIRDINSTRKILDNINASVELEKEVDDFETLKYQDISFFAIDFSFLKEKNKEVVGYIEVVGTDIKYPYLQTNNNNYYLSHSFDNSSNSSGWVFLDYRNNKDFLDRNTIIYAHGGNRFSMFGPLKNLYDNETWYDFNKHYIKIVTENSKYLFEVFSLYVIKTTSDYLKINFSNDFSYKLFIDKIKSRSYYEFPTTISVDDKIITLSTCYNKKEKLVLHGKLVFQI